MRDFLVLLTMLAQMTVAVGLAGYVTTLPEAKQTAVAFTFGTAWLWVTFTALVGLGPKPPSPK